MACVALNATANLKGRDVMSRPATRKDVKKGLLQGLFAAALTALIGIFSTGISASVRSCGRSSSTSSTRTGSCMNTHSR